MNHLSHREYKRTQLNEHMETAADDGIIRCLPNPIPLLVPHPHPVPIPADNNNGVDSETLLLPHPLPIVVYTPVLLNSLQHFLNTRRDHACLHPLLATGTIHQRGLSDNEVEGLKIGWVELISALLDWGGNDAVVRLDNGEGPSAVECVLQRLDEEVKGELLGRWGGSEIEGITKKVVSRAAGYQIGCFLRSTFASETYNLIASLSSLWEEEIHHHRITIISKLVLRMLGVEVNYDTVLEKMEKVMLRSIELRYYGGKMENERVVRAIERTLPSIPFGTKRHELKKNSKKVAKLAKLEEEKKFEENLKGASP